MRVPANRPADALGHVNGLYYKIGVHGRAFYHANGKWLKSERPAREIEDYFSMRVPRRAPIVTFTSLTLKENPQ
jgi:hypothetical protein